MDGSTYNVRNSSNDLQLRIMGFVLNTLIGKMFWEAVVAYFEVASGHLRKGPGHNQYT